MTKRPPCRRCLLKDLDGEYFRSVYQYIKSLPQEQRASGGSYARRLALCRGCESLQNGMCAHCGCFVEVRAAKRRQSCPVGKWEEEGPLANAEQPNSNDLELQEETR